MHNPMPLVITALAVTTLPLSGCSQIDAATSHLAISTSVTTVTVTATPGTRPANPTDVVSAAGEWKGGADGTALFSVGQHPVDDLATAIPPGHYTVRLASGAQSGSWMLCDTPTCGPAFQEDATIVGHPIGTASSSMFIGPRSRTLWLDNVVIAPTNG